MRVHGDQGNAATETVLLVPVVLLVVLFVVFVGRISSTDDDIQGAARDAARAASQSATADAAAAVAQQTAADTLDTDRVRCDGLQVAVDTNAFVRGGAVIVDIRCTVSLADVLGLAVPGSATRTAHAVEVIDQHRGVA